MTKKKKKWKVKWEGTTSLSDFHAALKPTDNVLDSAISLEQAGLYMSACNAYLIFLLWLKKVPLAVRKSGGPFPLECLEFDDDYQQMVIQCLDD